MLAATPPPVKPRVRVYVALQEVVRQGSPAFRANAQLFGITASSAFQQ
jgi:hypothetical protein